MDRLARKSVLPHEPASLRTNCGGRPPEAFARGADRLNVGLAELDLGLTDYQLLLHFGGAPDAKRAAMRQEAISMLDTDVRVDARRWLTPTSIDPAGGRYAPTPCTASPAMGRHRVCFLPPLALPGRSSGWSR